MGNHLGPLPEVSDLSGYEGDLPYKSEFASMGDSANVKLGAAVTLHGGVLVPVGNLPFVGIHQGQLVVERHQGLAAAVID